jgi:hypothetical protein
MNRKKNKNKKWGENGMFGLSKPSINLNTSFINQDSTSFMAQLSIV